MPKSLSEREGYLAMVEFLRAYVERARGGSLAALLADIEIMPDARPYDEASWTDWLTAIAAVRSRKPDGMT